MGTQLDLDDVAADHPLALHELAALRLDAERYRWLRDCAAQEIQFDHTTVDAYIGLLIPCRWSSDPSLCDAIDAARLATPAVGAA